MGREWEGVGKGIGRSRQGGLEGVGKRLGSGWEGAGEGIEYDVDFWQGN